MHSGMCCERRPRRVGRRQVLVLLIGAAGSVTVACTSEQLAQTGELLAISPQQAEALGLDTWTRIRQEQEVSPDTGLQQRLQAVGQRLVAANDFGQQNWEFVVFRNDQINAFALPGGKVGFYEGIFNVMDNDAHVATVMGHEIGHVTEQHGAQRIGVAQASELGLQAVSTALEAGNIAYANQIAGLLGAGVQYGVILPYSRGQELEADQVGVLYMARAGYDPRQSISFWQNMSQAKGGGQPPEFLSTHPSDQQRIAGLEALMPRAVPVFEQARS